MVDKNKKVLLEKEYASLSGAKRAEKAVQRYGIETKIEKFQFAGRQFYRLIMLNSKKKASVVTGKRSAFRDRKPVRITPKRPRIS